MGARCVEKCSHSRVQETDIQRGVLVLAQRTQYNSDIQLITVTNDYEKADFVITHDEFYKKFSSGEKILTSIMLYKLWNYEAFPGTGGYVKFADNYHAEAGNSIIWDLRLEEYCSSHRIDNPESLYDEWAIPALSLNIAYLIDTGELDVVNVNEILCQSANKIDLTKELVDDITNWMSSYNEENFALVAKVIPTINVENKPHLLWQLAHNIYNSVYRFNRDKDVQYWLETSRLHRLYNLNAEGMILELEKTERLDTESFRYLEPIVRREIRIHNRDLYVFKVHVKPEYRKFLKNQK